MAAKQKSEEFQIEDWAIREEELPWNASAAARFQAPNIVCLEQYRRKRKPDTQGPAS
jgi:hypothetical protein